MATLPADKLDLKDEAVTRYLTRFVNADAKPLLRDDDGKVIAVACQDCGRLALNVEAALCAECWMRRNLLAWSAK